MRPALTGGLPLGVRRKAADFSPVIDSRGWGLDPIRGPVDVRLTSRPCPAPEPRVNHAATGAARTSRTRAWGRCCGYETAGGSAPPARHGLHVRERVGAHRDDVLRRTAGGRRAGRHELDGRRVADLGRHQGPHGGQLARRAGPGAHAGDDDQPALQLPRDRRPDDRRRALPRRLALGMGPGHDGPGRLLQRHRAGQLRPHQLDGHLRRRRP